MLAFGTDLLKSIVPTIIADQLPAAATSAYANRMDVTHPPLTPFCCASAIPGTLRYLAELLPASTTHNVLAKPLTATALLTAFLLYVIDCYCHSHEARGKEVIQASAVNLHFAIVQLTVTKTVKTTSASKIPALSSKNIRQAAVGPSSRRSSSGSMVQFATIEEGFENVMLSEPSTTSQYRSAKPSSQSVSEEKEIKYFVPLENSREATILSESQKLKGAGSKAWKEITEKDAMESLRLPGSKIGIGDGETWKELEGKERMECETHGMVFELKAWVRMSW